MQALRKEPIVDGEQTTVWSILYMQNVVHGIYNSRCSIHTFIISEFSFTLQHCANIGGVQLYIDAGFYAAELLSADNKARFVKVKRLYEVKGKYRCYYTKERITAALVTYTGK